MLTTICVIIFAVIFLTLVYALLSANHDEEEYVNDYEWVRDEFKIPEDDVVEDKDD